MGSGLSPLQTRVLELLSGMDPPWTLSGGGALVGFHLRHRATRDLDLFWHGADRIDASASEVRRRLSESGLEVDSLQSTPAFVRLRVSANDRDVVVLDLVAEPVSTVEEPVDRSIGRVRVRVDTPHEILVNKLCALLGRRELRDLSDVAYLLAAGGDLDRALADAPRKDGGFSPLTLAWILRDMPVAEMASSEGHEDAGSLGAARDDLVGKLLAAARPEE